MNNLKTKVLIALAGLTLTGASVLPAATVLADSTDKNISTKISFDQATKTALKEAKTGKITQIELENKKNKPVYEVTILDDKTEKEYKIDGNSGKVIKHSTEDISDDKEDVQLSQATPKLSLNDAEKKAKEKYSSAKLREIKLDIENGKTVYKVKLQDNNKKIKLVLNADDGTILSEKTKWAKKPTSSWGRLI